MPTTGIFSQHAIYRDQYADRITGILIGLLTCAAILFPRALPFFYFSTALLAFVELARANQLTKLLRSPGHFWILAVIFTVWCLITVLWAATPMAATGKVVFLAAVFLAAWTIMNWLTTISATMSLQIKLGYLIGFLIAAAIVAIEVLFEQPIKKIMIETFDFLVPASGKHIRYEDGKVLYIGEYHLNRTIAVLNMFFWPAILIILKLLKAHLRLLALAVATGLVAISTYYSAHQSSMIAFALGAIVFALMGLAPRLARISVAVAWICATLLVLPAILGAYNAQLHTKEWLPYTAKARIALWAHTARNYTENPIGGIGVRSTKYIYKTTRPRKAVQPIRPEDMGTGRHGHNIYLQTWYELGVIGAILLALTGLGFLARINKLPANAKPYAFAAFSVAATLAAFTWGMWQVWYLSMFAMAAATMMFAGHQFSPSNRDKTG